MVMASLSPCPLCQKKDFQTVFKKNKRQVVKCLNDDLVFVNPQPAKTQVAALYGPQYFKNFDPYLKNREAHLGYFNKKLGQIEKRIKKKGKILDIGCALGFFLQEAGKRGWEAWGIDVSDFALNYCRRQGLQVKKGTIKEVNFPKESFNVVVSFQTIEHETNPLNHAREIYRILKPSGLAILTTPDHDSWTRKLMSYYWFGYRHREHLFFLTRETLKIILETASFRKIEIERDTPRIFTASYYLTRLSDFYPNKFFKKTVGVVKRIIGGFPIPVLTDPWGDILVFAWKEEPPRCYFGENLVSIR